MFWIKMWSLSYCKLTLSILAKNTLLGKYFEFIIWKTKIMLSQGSSNITWPTWEKKIQKVNNQILYHQGPMCVDQLSGHWKRAQNWPVYVNILKITALVQTKICIRGVLIFCHLFFLSLWTKKIEHLLFKKNLWSTLKKKKWQKNFVVK